MDQSEKSVRFGGIERLYGASEAAAIGRAHVCVIGVGGVGSWVVEALARTGVGKLTLVDLDEVCASNVNRQLHALTNTVGRGKAEVLRERAMQINPQLEVTVIEDFFTAKTADMILASSYDVVVDCIDQFKNKVVMLDACRARKQKIVVVGGAGGRRDPTRIKVADMSRSEGDVLLAMLRKRLRQKHGFPRKGTWGIRCVYSDEVPRGPASCEVPRAEEPGTEGPGTEGPGTEGPGTEGPGTEEPGTEEPGTEEPGTEGRGTEEPGTEGRGTEGPGAAEPRADHPSARDPGSGIGDRKAESLRLDCATGYGAATFVTGTFGFLASAAAIDVILRRATSYTSP